MISHWYELHCSFLYCCSLDKETALADAKEWYATESALGNDAEIELVPFEIDDNLYENLKSLKALRTDSVTIYVNFIVEYSDPIEEELISFKVDENNEERSRGCKFI